MISKSEIERDLGVKIAMTGEMRDGIRLWYNMLRNKQGWINNRTKGLRLPIKIVDEFARLVLFNASITVAGSDRADYINGVLQSSLSASKTWVRMACAMGGVILRPVMCGKKMRINCVTADKIYPIEYDDDGMITSVAMLDSCVRGIYYYHRLEVHKYDGGTCTIHNFAYRSRSADTLGDPCSLKDTGIWAGVEAKKEIIDLSGPLFAHFGMPSLNTIDPDCPLGMSVYGEAKDLIRDADEHWAKIKWEYEATQTAIDAPLEYFKKTESGIILPDNRDRIYRKYDVEPDGKLGLQIFSPQIRDASLFAGLNGIFKRIEYNCNLAYGMISDPQAVEKTAEEVRSSKQRCYSAVSDIQDNLRKTLHELVRICGDYCNAFGLVGYGAVNESFEFGDGVMEDPDKEFARRMQMRTAGMLSDDKFVAWYFDCDEAMAADYKPTAPVLFGGGGDA